MKKTINSEHIEGRVYQHNLSVKTVQNKDSANFGKPFISGTLDVATDENGLNVITTHFTYVTEMTSKGGKNNTYVALQRIINEGKAWITDGKDAATKVKIDTALALNDFYTQDDSLVSAKRNEGGFVTIVNDLCPENERNTFQVDMLITSVVRTDIDEERNITEPFLTLKGAIFNFRNALLPIDFIVRNSAGMNYFEGLDISNANPVFTKVWGRINCMTSVIEGKEESAFGDAAVKTYEKKTKEWTITGTSKIPYDFGDEAVLTIEDINKAAQDREVYLASIKKANEEYKASKMAAAAKPTMTLPVGGNFTF